MKTRNAETPKSGGPKKTQPTKKDPACAEKATGTPATAPGAKATPKSKKVTPAKRSTPKTPAPVASPAAKPEPTEEATPSSDTKPASPGNPPDKKPAGKTKSPLLSATKVAVSNPLEATEAKEERSVKPEEQEQVAAEVKGEDEVKEDMKQEGEVKEDVKPEEPEKITASEVKIVMEDPQVTVAVESAVDDKAPQSGDTEMEEYSELEGFQEPADEEIQDEEGDEEHVEGGGVDEGERGLAEEEQLQISDMAKQRKLKKAHEIFVGGLDRDAMEEDLKKAFESIGEVVEVRLHKDFVTNKNKGFAFVKFADQEQATRALSELKNPMIRGKRCGIAPSEDNDTLFLGNICNTWTKEAIRRKLKDYGVDGVEGITLVSDTRYEGLSRGFAFLEFSCHADAMLAYKRLQNPDIIFGHPERTAKVAFAEPLREPDAEVMAQVKSVFIDGLPPYWDEDRVREQFKGYGEIERIVLARNMPTAKRKDFGFVNFTTHESAIACIEAVNNTELGDGKSKLKARARLANPLPKTQAVKGGMRGGFRIGLGGMGGYSRFAGRGFGRGRHPSFQAGFRGGRGFFPRGRGRFPFATDNFYDFRGRRPFGVRGGRRGSFRGNYEFPSEEFLPPVSSSARRGAFAGGRARPFQSRRQPYPLEGDFPGSFDGHYGEDPYYYGDFGHGIKRPFSTMEDSDYLDPGSRLRTRYDHADPLASGTRYRDSYGSGGGLYSHDYYGSDYGGSGYSSLYRGEGSGGGYYY